MSFTVKSSLTKKAGNVDWSSFDKFEDMTEKYLPRHGEGDTMATQAWVAISKLVYRYYNDGDIPDNQANYNLDDGWANDLSSYANWLDQFVVPSFYTDYCNLQSLQEYENLLFKLTQQIADMIKSGKLDKPKVGSIYSASGPFVFKEAEDDYEDYEEDYEEEEDEEEDKY